MKSARVLATLLTALFGLSFLSLLKVAESDDLVFDGTGGAIVMTPDGSMLIVVNPDSNSVSVVNLDLLETTQEICVGIEPKMAAVHPHRPVAYVANHGSDEISVLDLDKLTVHETIPVGDRPVGLAVSRDGTLIVVAEYGCDTVRIVEAKTLETLAVVPVADRPYAVACTPDDETLVVTHLYSGTVSVIDLETGSIDTVSTWPGVAPAPAVAINADGTRCYLPQTMAHGLGRNTQFDNTVFAKVSAIDLEHRLHVAAEHISLPEKDQPVGLPWAVALADGDTELWVVNGASNDVSILDIADPARPRRLGHVVVSDNPRGIVIDEQRHRAYVNNVLAGTVSVIDTATYTVIAEIEVTRIPLPPVLLTGKRLFNTSARPDVSRASWISCNTCHIEGEHDGRTWLLQYLGDVPLYEDPVVRRNTTSLLGMIETYPLRWSAEWDESADSEFSIRFEQFGTGLIDGEMNPTLGEPNQGRSYELDCLAAYIDSLRVPERKHALTESEQRGKALFESDIIGCSICHPGPLYTDLKQHDVGTVDGKDAEWFGPLIDTPSLRFLYDSAPYFHDGSAETLMETITYPSPNGEHDVTDVLSEDQMRDLIRFLLALPYA
jgi:YVTN family beta-propeller protein